MDGRCLTEVLESLFTTQSNSFQQQPIRRSMVAGPGGFEWPNTHGTYSNLGDSQLCGDSWLRGVCDAASRGPSRGKSVLDDYQR